MMSKSAGLVFGVGILLAVGIFVLSPSSSSDSPAPGALSPAAAASGQLPEGHPPIAGQAAPAATADGPFGTVQETMTSAGYTYARVASGGEEIWVAGPPSQLTVGDEISLAGAMGMENFTAKSLDRTFESILFLNSFSARAASAPEQTGTAMEILHAAGYTYVRVDRDGNELWIAGMSVDVKEGQTVAWSAGAVMANFDSPSLGRTFDEILFVDGLRIVG